MSAFSEAPFWFNLYWRMFFCECAGSDWLEFCLHPSKQLLQQKPAGGNFLTVHYVLDTLANSQVIYKRAPISTVSCS